MISVNMEKIEIKGAAPVVYTEMEALVRAFKEMLEEKHGKDETEEIFNQILENASKSDEQIEKETAEFKKQASGLLKDILKEIMEGLGE